MKLEIKDPENLETNLSTSPMISTRGRTQVWQNIHLNDNIN